MVQDNDRCPGCNSINLPNSLYCVVCSKKLISEETSAGNSPIIPQERPGCIIAYVVLLVAAAGFSIYMSSLALLGRLLRELSTSNLNSDTVLGLTFFWGSAVLFLWIASGLWRLQNWARIAIISLQGFAILLTGALNPCGLILQLPISGYIIYWFASHDKYFKKEYTQFFKEAALLIVVGILALAVFFKLP